MFHGSAAVQVTERPAISNHSLTVRVKKFRLADSAGPGRACTQSAPTGLDFMTPVRAAEMRCPVKLWRRAAQGLIIGGLSFIVLGLGAGVAGARPTPTPPPPPYLPLIPDPGPVDEYGRVHLDDMFGAVCNNAGVVCLP